MISTPSLAVLLESFFTQRLMKQRQASSHTISSYRDTFRLLLKFAQTRLGKTPSHLALEEIDAPLIAAFLEEMEKSRGISPRSRNLRLTAIRSFFHYAALEAPAQSAQIQRVLAIPGKRHTRLQVHFLMRPEVEALLDAPDQHTWSGRRDHALLLVAVQTGLRLSELTGLQRQDLSLETGAHIRVVGKGRKERCIPLTKQTVTVLKAWLREPARGNLETLFPNPRGGRLSADGVQYLLAKHTAVACKACPSLQQKRVTPHMLRHTMAMELLQAGVDRAEIDFVGLLGSTGSWSIPLASSKRRRPYRPNSRTSASRPSQRRSPTVATPISFNRLSVTFPTPGMRPTGSGRRNALTSPG